MSLVQPLPLELVLEILLYVFVDVRGKPHKQFGALSLVCKAWRSYAQRLLFRNVRILHPGAAHGFLEATVPESTNEDAERLGKAVRTLEVSIGSKQMISLLPFILRHCPRLYELSVSFYTNMNIDAIANPPATPDTIRAYSTVHYSEIPLPQISALQVSHTSTLSKLTDKLLQLWPGVRHLVVSGTALEELCLRPRRDTDPAIRLQLHELQTGRIGVRSSAATAGFLQSFLRPSTGTLTMLDLNGISEGLIELSEQLFIEHGPYLRSLRLPILSLKVRMPFIKYCVELEEIVVYGYPPMSVYKDCPVAKIQHASFATIPSQINYSPKPALTWLDTFPALVVVSWSARGVSKSPQLTKDLDRVQRFCAKKGVRFRSSSMFDIQEELISPISYPRDELMTAVWR